MNSPDNYERVHFPDPIQCPECGLHTHELSRIQNGDGYGVAMICDTCYEDYDKEQPTGCDYGIGG